MPTFGVLKSGCVLSFCIIPQDTHRPPPEHKHKSTQSYHACYSAHEVLHVSLVFTKQLLVTDEILAKLAQKPSQKMRFFKFLGRWAKRKRDQNLTLSGRFGDSQTGFFLPYPGGGGVYKVQIYAHNLGCRSKTFLFDSFTSSPVTLMPLIKSLFLLYL